MREQQPHQLDSAERPDVTVVVPMHNELENLPGTLDRITAELKQTGYTFEIVAVDDGSTYTTRNRLETMAKSDPRVRVESYPGKEPSRDG